MVGVSAEMLNASLEFGYNMIVAGGDVFFLAGGSTKASADARAIVEGRATKSDGKPGASASPY